MPVFSDASSTRRPMSWPRRASQGNSLGGHGRRQDHRLSWQVGAQVPSRLVPVLGPVTAQFHPCLMHRRLNTSLPSSGIQELMPSTVRYHVRERFQLQYCFVVIFIRMSILFAFIFSLLIVCYHQVQ